MHILLYGLLAILLVPVLFFLWGAVGMFAIFFSSTAGTETKSLATFACNASELRLMYHYQSNENRDIELLYFEFDKNGTTTATGGVDVAHYDMQLSQLPLYHSTNTLITPFSDFTFDYKKQHAWNLKMSGDVANPILFSELSKCMTTHNAEINTVLQTFKPKRKVVTYNGPRTINSIVNITNREIIRDVEFTCEKDGIEFHTYAVTMAKEGNSYKAQIAEFDRNNYTDESEKYPDGFWLVNLTSAGVKNPTISDFRECKNPKGETFGTYFDAFPTFALTLKIW